MASLVIAEHDNAALKDATHKTVTPRRKSRRRCMCWWRARIAAPLPKPPPRSPGSRKVLLADAPSYARQLAEPMEALLLTLADKAMTPSSRRPPPTARTSCRGSPPSWTWPQISEILKVISPDTFERPIYAGNAIETVQAPAGIQDHHRAHHRLQGGGGKRQRHG